MGRAERVERLVREVHARRSIALALAFVTLGACLDDRGTAPSDQPTLRLGLSAQVVGAARTVEIRVSYRRLATDGETIELVRLPSAPSSVTVEPGETRVQEIEVQVEPCLTDPRRAGPQTPNGCPIVVELLLLGEGGVVVDNAVIEPEVDDVTQPVTLPPVTLSPPVIVLAPTALAFEAVAGGPIPVERSVAITNGGGGELTGLAASITFVSGTEWLTASINPAGHLVVRPSTTALAPGTYQANVAVASPPASNTPQSVAVSYVVAVPPPKLLTVTGASTGAGRVTSTPPGIDCTIAAGVGTGTCTASFVHGTVVILAQAPNTGSTFGGWTGACTSSTACSVTMDQPRDVTASFTMIRHTLTVGSGGGTGSGTVTGPGIACTIAGSSATGDCSETFDFGTSVSLAATPGANMTFAAWGESCSGTGACQVTMTSARLVLASFAPALRALTVTGAGTGAGRVTSNVGVLDCSIEQGDAEGLCSLELNHGTVVTLTAAPTAPSTFAGWSGACTGTSPCQVTLDQARTVTARFDLPNHLLGVSSGGGTGSGVVTSNPAGIACGIGGAPDADCSEGYLHGQQVTLTATASPNNVFVGWGGACSSREDLPTCALTMDQARSVTATFDLVKQPLTVTLAGNGVGVVVSNPIGINCFNTGPPGSDCAGFFDHGTSVRLAAASGPHSTFAGWSGEGCSGTGFCDVTLTQARSVTATFALVNYALVVAPTGTGSGRVTSAPPGIDCLLDDGMSGSCSAPFLALTTVSLSATATNGSAFTGWSGACSGTGPCSVPMDQARSVTATFTLIPRQLTVLGAGNGNGSVTSDPAGITCAVTAGATGGDCTELLDHGSIVTLTAQPDVNSLFTGWSGAGCTGTGSCQVTMTQASSVTATFTLRNHLLTVSSGGGTGSGVVSATGITCGIGGAAGTDCTESYLHGTVVTLTATPTPNHVFAGWGGVCTGTGTCQVTMDQARSVTASFTAPFLLSVAGAGNGSGSVASTPTGIACTITAGAVTGTCTQLFALNTMVTLTPSPTAPSTFAGWSGACTGTGTCQVTMSQARNVTATFSLPNHVLTVASGGGNGSGSVSSVPAGITCGIGGGTGTDCTEPYVHGTVVTLTPSATNGSTFTGWGAPCVAAGTGPCTVTMDQARTVTATFTLVPRLLTVAGAGTGNGTVTSLPAGINCAVAAGVASGDCTESYSHGTVVTLTAAANANQTFAGWSGGGCTGTGPCQVTMDQARAVTATFTQTVHRLTVRGSGTGHGTITSQPSGIDCRVVAGVSSGACEFDFPQGTEVTLSPTADANSNPAGWTGACEQSGGQCVLTMTQPATATAGFTLKTFNLTVARPVGNTGNGTVTGGGIDCVITGLATSGQCTVNVAIGTVVTLTATAGVNSTFGGFTGCSVATSPCSVTVTAPTTVIASFPLLTRVLTVTLAGNGTGTVVSTPSGIACTNVPGGPPSDCTQSYDHGTSVTLTPTPGPSSLFSGWSGGGCTGTGNCVVPMTQAQNVTATFSPSQFTLTVGGAGTGSGTVRSSVGTIVCDISAGVPGNVCSNVYASGTTVRLDPFPNANSTFGGWTGDCTNATGSCTVTMSQARNVTARFNVIMLPVTVDPAVGNTGNGTITSTPAGIDCAITGATKTGTCVLSVPIGTTVSLTQTPAAGHTFGGWGNACTGTGACNVSMTTGARTVTAAFSPSPYTVIVNGAGDGNGRVQSQAGLTPAIDCTSTRGADTGTCQATYPAGTRVELRATAATPGAHTFTGWGTACTGSSQPCVPPSTAGTTATVLAFFDFDPCVPVPHLIGERVTDGQISSSFDCQIGTGKYRDSYLVTPPQVSLFRADMSGSMPSELRVSFLATPPGGVNGFEWFASSSGFISHWILAPAGGNVRLDAANRDPSDFGSYIFSSVALGSAPVCAPLRTTFGLTNVGFDLLANDCSYTANLDPAGPDGARAADRFTIFVPSGQTWTVTVTNTTVGSPGFQPLIELRDGFDDARPAPGGPERAFIASTWAQTPGNTASLTRTGGSWVSIWVVSRTAGATGTYTITIQ